MNSKKLSSLALTIIMTASFTLGSAGALAATPTPTPTPTPLPTFAPPSSPLKYGDAIPLTTLEKYTIGQLIDADGTIVSSTADPMRNAKPQALGTSDLYAASSYSGWLQTLSQKKLIADRGYEYDIQEATAEDEMSVEEPMADSDNAPAPAPSAVKGSDYSTTNVQVAGIDEADVIKTDGKYIYYLGGQDKKGISIVSVVSGSMKEVGYIDCGEYNNFSDMYISGDRLIVVAQYHRYSYGSGRPYYSLKDYTAFYVYNIKNRAKPTLERKVRAEGSLLSSRFYDNTVFFVTNKYANYMPLEATLADAMPAYSDSAVGTEFYGLAPKNIRYLTKSEDHSLMMVGSFRIDEKKPARFDAYLGAGSTIYMNQRSMYVVRSNWYAPNSESVIYRFNVKDSRLDYADMAAVPGTIINQYSMDEYNKYFRIATTTDNQTSGVYVLNSDTMKLTGKVTGLAKGERIYSVRFSGKTAYVVTFKNMDPLFVIDLASPFDPRVVGELKIPGFSQYLHTFGSNYLIGIGRETTETYAKDSKGNLVVTGNMDRGLKLSLFDVSNPQKPKEIAKKVIGGSNTYTYATSNPKSIMFDLKKNLFAFPLTYNDYDNLTGEGSEKWTGGLVVNVDPKKGFSIKAKMVDTSDSYYYYNSNTRFCYIGNALYFAAGGKITSYNYTTFSKLASIKIYTVK